MEEALLLIQKIKAMYQSKAFSKSDQSIAEYILNDPGCLAGATANSLAKGIFQTEGIRKGVSGGWIMAGGVICYVVLLVISNLVFHRMVTTELFLIVGWAVLNLVTVNTLYASGLFSAGISVVFCVLTLAVVVGSLYCYMIYYNLEKWKGYIDGFLPLVMVGIAMLVMAGVMFYKK